MISPGRSIGLVLVLGGVSAGTLLDRVPDRPVARAGPDYVLAADLHVHAFVGDGGLAPWELPREARRRGLDVIAVTNHNQLLGARIAARMASTDDPLIIVGEEVTAPDYHLAAVGVEHRIDWWLPAADAIAAVQAQGGVAIAAHPSLKSWRPRDQRTLATVDGAEVAQRSGTRLSRLARERLQFFSSASARNPSLAAIGSSDFHYGGTMGQSRTFIFARDASQAGVLEAIREARTVAYDGQNRFYGDPVRVKAVRELLDKYPFRRRTDTPSRLAAYSVLFGLVVLLLWK